jgi:hypothetical protein
VTFSIAPRPDPTAGTVANVDVDAFAAAPVGPLRAELWWRHCYLPSDPRAQDPLYVSAATPSRWQTAGGTLYLGDRATTVWCEYLRNTPRQVESADPTAGIGLASESEVRALAREALAVVPRGLWRVRVDLDRVVNFTSSAGRAALIRAGVDLQELTTDDYGLCPDIAAAYTRFDWQAILAPSAALPEGRCVAVFSPHYPARRAWEQIEEAALPTVLHAYLTRFRSGERPSWLPVRVPV